MPLNHGTRNGYKYYGCRCDLCRKASAEYQLKIKYDRIRRANKGKDFIPHGTNDGYNNYKCRCEPCVQANRDYVKRGD